MLDFNNTEKAFSAQSNRDLKNAYLLFSAIRYPWFVKLSAMAVKTALKIHFPLSWAVKPTLYKQFIGGETLEECRNTVDKLLQHQVYSTLDYSAEGEQTPAGIRAVFEETLRSIDFAGKNPGIAYAVFKPSTLAPKALLHKAGEGKPLSGEEQNELAAFRDRFLILCEQAARKEVRLLVDAEEYVTQGIFDELTEQAMRRFNTQKAIVFTTLQMYRHDRLEYLRYLLRDTREHHYIAGVKFVRGAYMEAERERARLLGYPDPICKDKQTTDANFDTGVAFAVEHLKHFEIFMGSHNQESNYKLARLLEGKGIARNDRRVFFAQLLGMSDHISFNLAAQGYNVTKYVPYASVRDALPYLLRRAQENSFVSGQTGRELSMIRAEIERRKAKKSKPQSFS